MIKLEIFTHGSSEQEDTRIKDQKLKHTRAFVRGLDVAEYTAFIYDFTEDAQAYMANDEVRTLLHEQGDTALPLILLNNTLVCSGSYPTNDELADLLKIGCTEIGDGNSTCCSNPCCE